MSAERKTAVWVYRAAAELAERAATKALDSGAEADHTAAAVQCQAAASAAGAASRTGRGSRQSNEELHAAERSFADRAEEHERAAKGDPTGLALLHSRAAVAARWTPAPDVVAEAKHAAAAIKAHLAAEARQRGIAMEAQAESERLKNEAGGDSFSPAGNRAHAATRRALEASTAAQASRAAALRLAKTHEAALRRQYPGLQVLP